MSNDSVGRVWRGRWASGLGFLALLLPLSGARAADPLGIYAGGAVGQARIDASLPDATQFREDHTAFKILLGLRPVPVLGAELEYLDFGHPGHFEGIVASDVSMKGEAAFGMVYIPVPLVDVYAKGGLARLKSTAAATIVCPPGLVCIALALPAPLNRTNTSWAGGAGVQFKVAAVGIGAEYERFNAAGGNPYLLSLGATWTF